jgi:uncharacterized protein with GYD domain
MPKYLFQGSYTTTGVQGMLKEGAASRRAMLEKMTADMGGSIECFYNAMGENSIVVIAELPDMQKAIAISLAVNAGGGANVSTTLLVTPEEIDEAAKLIVNYRPPGE